MTKPTAGELRTRLVEIDDEIRALSPDDFARKHELRTEADACRRALDAEVGEEAGKAGKEWAERAGRKGSHEVDPEVAKALTRAFAPDSSSTA